MAIATNPRSRQGSPLLRLLVAVLSGVASAFVIQQMSAPEAVKTARKTLKAAQELVDKVSPPPDVPVPLPQEPLTLEGKPLATGTELPPGTKTPDLKPNPSSMLVKPEPGGAPEGVLRHYSDDPVGKTRTDELLRYDQTRKPDFERSRKDIRLKERSMRSDFARVDSQGVGRGFNRVEFQGLGFKRPEDPPEAPRPKEVVPEAKKGIKLLEKPPMDESQILVASAKDPQDFQPKPYWSQERKARVGAAGMVALVGFFWVFFGSGAFGALSEKKG